MVTREHKSMQIQNLSIYFAASIRGGRQEIDAYTKLIKHLSKHGTVLTEHISLPSTFEDGQSDIFIHDRDVTWLKNCDIVIADVTVPSLGVGYEIALATQLQKPVLCLNHIEKNPNLSAMISGCQKIVKSDYASIEEAYNAIDSFIMKKTSPKPRF